MGSSFCGEMFFWYGVWTMRLLDRLRSSGRNFRERVFDMRRAFKPATREYVLGSSKADVDTLVGEGPFVGTKIRLQLLRDMRWEEVAVW